MQELKGVGVALVTPFQENGKVDFSGLEKIVGHVGGGVHFLVVMGTTGEAATLSELEQLAVLDFVLEINQGKLPVVFGMGGSDTAGLAERMKGFDKEGVAAFLTASPAYNKPTQEGIFRHYARLGKASPLPIIMYNVPGRTASNVVPQTVNRIAREAEGIMGIKEAAGSIEQVMELAAILPDDFLLLSGDDPLLVPHMACGGHGIISVLANAYPKRFRAVYDATLKSDFTKAREVQFQLQPFINDLFAEGNPGGIKEALQHMGICEHHLRLPLHPVSEAHSKTLYKDIAELGEE